ncbi:alpha-galactosidase [Paenibacillus aurantius]|uniref:Alpha-galactosidase n=1 Tax=Paenibacillus aurantius TaxID=2918900 RepID=A0AA96RG71_9BACL|nr:alpha-galactosidase [Paenibacillus aurantius]WNQ12221.1 alpha-galactosidase [Paenibacillus aurantius]
MLKQALHLNRASVRVVLSNQTLEVGAAERTNDGAAVYRAVSLSVSLEPAGDAGVLAVSIHNEGLQEVGLRRVLLEWPASFFQSSLDARDYIQLYHPRDFMKLCGIRPVHRPNDWSRPADASGMVSVLRHRQTGDSILLGAVPPYGDCFVDLPILHEEPHHDGAFGFGFHLQAPRTVGPGQRVTLAHLMVLQGGNGIDLLNRYADVIRTRLKDFSPRPERITGWNTWDYYSGAVRAEDVARNAAKAREQYGDALTYIVIDEGYERQWGIWEAGWKFEEGLSAVCEQIRSSGYEPGIWTAPLLVNVYTPLYREHPDWFAGDEQGNVYLEDTAYGVMAQLDITHPEVEAHIRRTYEHLHSAGFTYFKCDFAQLLLGASTFHRSDMSHAGMIRRLFEVIRETIGAESYLLACGAPYEAVIGIADAHRTTGDIHNYWSHIRQNIRSMFGRGWMQGSIGNTDPDTAIVRCKETSDDKQPNRRSKRKPWSAGANWTSGRKMSLTEAKTLLLACYVTGGDLILGDALTKLNPLGTELLDCLLRAPIQRGMIPLNLFEPDGDELPIVLTESGVRTLLVLFNLGDDYRTQAIPPECMAKPHEWKEFWSGQDVPAPASGAVELAPRSALAWWLV